MSMNDENNDSSLLTNDELLSIYGTSSPAGNKQVNAVKAQALYGGKLVISGDAFIYGCMRTPLQLCAGVYFGDGTEVAPSITFIGDTMTGLYRTGNGLIGFASQGVTDMVVGNNAVQIDAEITTSMGSNLVINPSGSSIDFSGKTLINIGGISTNPNRYEIIAPTTIITPNATPTTVLIIPTVTGAAYTIIVDVAIACVTDSISTASIAISTKAKNIGGVVTAVTPYARYHPILDAALASISVAFTISGTNVLVTATGSASTTVKWQAAANITRQLF